MFLLNPQIGPFTELLAFRSRDRVLTTTTTCSRTSSFEKPAIYEVKDSRLNLGHIDRRGLIYRLGGIHEPQDAMIKKEEGGYKVVSERTGKNLGGPYKSKEKAKKRLRQVEYFKHHKG